MVRLQTTATATWPVFTPTRPVFAPRERLPCPSQSGYAPHRSKSTFAARSAATAILSATRSDRAGRAPVGHGTPSASPHRSRRETPAQPGSYGERRPSTAGSRTPASISASRRAATMTTRANGASPLRVTPWNESTSGGSRPVAARRMWYPGGRTWPRLPRGPAKEGPGPPPT